MIIGQVVALGVYRDPHIRRSEERAGDEYNDVAGVYLDVRVAIR